MKLPAATLSVTCYPQPGKRKAHDICHAFASGVRALGGQAVVLDAVPDKLWPGDAVFYGVRPAWAHLWAQAKKARRDWWYIDNAYFDRDRETRFRVTRNALQADGLNAAWRYRVRYQVKPWRQDGEQIVICPQTDEFMRVVGWDGDWLTQTLAALKKVTARPLWVRRKGDARPLAADLVGAHALVTHMSCAAVEALVAGVPVFCTGRCSARWMGTSALEDIERPVYPDGRQRWADLLAGNQWTLDEMARGEVLKAYGMA